MKFLVFLFIGVASAAYVGHHPYKTVNTDTLVKQKKVYELLNHLHQHTGVEEQEKFGKEFSFKKYREFFLKPEYVDQWLEHVHEGLESKTEVVTLTRKEDREEAAALFKVFYYAKDFETFYKVACWAREHVNAGIFAYSFSVALIHRADTQDLIIPSIYEIYPHYYTSSDVFQKVNRIKIQGYVADEKLANHYGVYSAGENKYIVENYFNASFHFEDQEQRLTYFYNDVGLNHYYYEYSLDHPFWLGGKDFHLNKDRRGELFYYFYQQFLARYTMERYANGLGEIPKFYWEKPVETGFNPMIIYHTGYPMPPRAYEYEPDHEYLEEVVVYERRIWDAIYKGYITLADGTTLPVKTPEDIETLGLFVQGNPDLGNYRFYDYFTNIAKYVYGGAYYREPYVPSALEQFATSTRDPVFYQLYARFMKYFFHFKDNLPHYTSHDVAFEGVKVDQVTFTPLVTYFEDFEFDITNGVYQTKEELEHSHEKFTFYARQERLNHKPFSVEIEVSSDHETDAAVRIFYGPKYDNFGHHIDFDINRHNFVMMDYFIYHLKNGKNVMHRESEFFAHTTYDFTDSRDVYHQVKEAVEQKSNLHFNFTDLYNGWPQNLLLPKGNKEGYEYQVYVVVTPYRPAKTPYTDGFLFQYTCAFDYKFQKQNAEVEQKYYYEELPFGYPFDRQIDEHLVQHTPNIYTGEFKVYHTDSYDVINQSTKH